MEKPRIIQRAANEFVFEYNENPKQKPKKGSTFRYDKIEYKVMIVKSGISGPGVYTFMVIAR